jgi:riboflavin kinase/FMN adenylyltransferase
MKVHFGSEKAGGVPSPVVTIGSFDGVHAGHRVILSRLKAIADRVGGETMLVTFHPHPRKVLYPDSDGKDLKLITTLEEKCILLEEAGLDHLVILEFTRSFARTTSVEFVEQVLAGGLGAHTIVVGFNHFFGHNKQGSYQSLYRDRKRFTRWRRFRNRRSSMRR